MPAILTPALALRHLRQLSTDVRAAAVLAADGRMLASHGAVEAALAEHARTLAGLLDPGGELLVRLDRDGAHVGSALALRAPARAPEPSEPSEAPDAPAALVVAAGPHALLPLLRHDAAQLLRDLGAGPVDAADPTATRSLTHADPLAIWAPSHPVELLGRADSTAATAIFAGLGLLVAGKP
jgi:hypothetical protein